MVIGDKADNGVVSERGFGELDGVVSIRPT
jgi:hypothetical protein